MNIIHGAAVVSHLRAFRASEERRWIITVILLMHMLCSPCIKTHLKINKISTSFMEHLWQNHAQRSNLIKQLCLNVTFSSQLLFLFQQSQVPPRWIIWTTGLIRNTQESTQWHSIHNAAHKTVWFTVKYQTKCYLITINMKLFIIGCRGMSQDHKTRVI